METPPLAENGMLASVPGEYIAAAMQQLPRASADLAEEPERRVEVDVPDFGRVRITLMVNGYRRGRAKFWHWVAVHAEQIQPAG